MAKRKPQEQSQILQEKLNADMEALLVKGRRTKQLEEAEAMLEETINDDSADNQNGKGECDDDLARHGIEIREQPDHIRDKHEHEK